MMDLFVSRLNDFKVADTNPDYNLGVGKVFLNIAFNGTFMLNGDGTGGGSSGNTLQIVTHQTVSGKFNFRVYATSPGNFIIVGTDNGRVVIGPLVEQQMPQ